nr:autophagy-related protein 9-like isoform X2 [Ziziphus jujuba var. spinosa]
MRMSLPDKASTTRFAFGWVGSSLWYCQIAGENLRVLICLPAFGKLHKKKENYLIGMLNKGVLAFPISKWVPGAGPTVKSGSKGKCRRLILTKTLEWTLNWCILQSMFDRTQWSWKV